MPLTHRDIDLRNGLQDRLLARRLRKDTGLLRLARKNLRRWQTRDGRRPRPAFLEWERILDYLSAGEIADFLVSDTPMARRLRQSSPFLGLFPKVDQPEQALSSLTHVLREVRMSASPSSPDSNEQERVEPR